VNIGLIGTGRIGQVHTFNIHNHLSGHKVTHAFDPFADRKWLSENNIIHISSIDELLNQKINCVLICSPSTEHVKQIISAAKKGKHVFCEKPIGLGIEEIELAMHVVRQEEVLLQIGFNRRFDPTFSQLQKRIADTVGIPQIIRITSRDSEIPSEEYISKSGGIFFDMTIHDFDMARFLAASEVVEVFATGSCLINPTFSKYKDIDTAMVQLEFSNGALGIIDNSRKSVYGYDQRLEVFSNKACLKAENRSKRNIQNYSKSAVTTYTFENFFLERYKDAYVNQFRSFFNSINLKKEPIVSGFDGLQAVKIAMAAQESFRKKAPVKL
jgi:myo-inositol 2-dehydrogenase/D-chiro-inositol 1-dehydrogenase